MIDSGVNPYIIDNKGDSQIEALSHLKIPEIPKSVYFSIYPDENYPAQIQQAWYYINGVFPGEFDEEVGKGSEGYVISGLWKGIKAAFKFVEIKEQTGQAFVDEGLKDLRKRLTEINALKEVQGSCILQEYGHFR